jgi:N-acetylmuramoyl-L-alanine amidase
MSISKKYSIEQRYIKKGKSRSGLKLVKGKPTFIVSHETANNSADADAHFNYFNNHQPSASAHTFIDDKKILEIVPLDEKAWHNWYSNPEDNQLFGEDANDTAAGVELCRTGDFKKAYDRYVWYHAYLCRKFHLNPNKEIVAHSVLDPRRRSDPQSWLNPNGVTWAQFINDVKAYYDAWTGDAPVKVEAPKTETKSEVIVNKPVAGSKTVRTVQSTLNSRYGLNIAVDGLPGPETGKALLKAFQSDLNKQFGARLIVDGVWGPKTLNAAVTVRKGAKGNITWIVQAALYCLKYEPNGLDGIFGAGTANAVLAFQKDYGLSQDAIVGPNTFAKMFNLL